MSEKIEERPKLRDCQFCHAKGDNDEAVYLTKALRLFDRLRLWLDVFQNGLRNRHWVAVIPQMQRNLPIRPYLRDLRGYPATVAFGGFSVGHARYVAQKAQEAR